MDDTFQMMITLIDDHQRWGKKRERERKKMTVRDLLLIALSEFDNRSYHHRRRPPITLTTDFGLVGVVVFVVVFGVVAVLSASNLRFLR